MEFGCLISIELKFFDIYFTFNGNISSRIDKKALKIEKKELNKETGVCFIFMNVKMYFEKQGFYSENIIDASKMRNCYPIIPILRY